VISWIVSQAGSGSIHEATRNATDGFYAGALELSVIEVSSCLFEKAVDLIGAYASALVSG